MNRVARSVFPALVMAMAGGAPVAAQQTHAVIVAGLGGAEPYRTSFRSWAVDLGAALVGRHGTPVANVAVLIERPSPDGHGVARSTRENVLAALSDVAGRAEADDRVLVVLIGHGTVQERVARLNLPGPDLTPGDLAEALSAFPTQSVAVVHTGSASGGFVADLAGPNRIVIASTASALERNATEFPRFFVEAVTTDGADLDKDRRVSLLEAFEYSNLEVARFYDEENELLTEHAVLDDNGDGEGSRQPIRDGDDGPRAATFHFGSGAGASATTAVPSTDDPELSRLYQERSEIQSRLNELRAARSEMSDATYEESLETLLVELALKAREIRAREVSG